MTIDLTTPEAQGAVLAPVGDSRNDPRSSTAKLSGAALRAAILRLTEDGKSLGEIADELGCSRAYASRVRNSPGAAGGIGRPAVLPKITIPPAVLARMLEVLRAGGSQAYDMALLQIDGVPVIFHDGQPRGHRDSVGGTDVTALRRSAIRKFVAGGAKLGSETQAHQLWAARQEGLLRRQVAA